MAFGRKPQGVDFKSIDDQPAQYFFLIVAPPLEVSNQYLPVLGKIAQFAKEPDINGRLSELQRASAAAPTLAPAIDRVNREWLPERDHGANASLALRMRSCYS